MHPKERYLSLEISRRTESGPNPHYETYGVVLPYDPEDNNRLVDVRPFREMSVTRVSGVRIVYDGPEKEIAENRVSNLKGLSGLIIDSQ